MATDGLQNYKKNAPCASSAEMSGTQPKVLMPLSLGVPKRLSSILFKNLWCLQLIISCNEGKRD
jgi:hypothetical protein